MCFFCQVNSITKEFKLLNSKWGNSQELGSTGGDVSYGFASQNVSGQLSDFDDFITDVSFQNEIVESLALWENSADIRFTLASNSQDADIRFGWRDIDGPGGVLGATTIPSVGGLQDVIVAFDIGENWFLGGDSPISMVDFSSTAAHEIGHAIGIDHSALPDTLMNASYSTTIFNLQQDDVDAAVAIYGENDVVKIGVYRFFNFDSGGHFFTTDIVEKETVEQRLDFRVEGVGFSALSRFDEAITGSIPVYRFLNPNLGSHLFTAFEEEKAVLLSSGDFIFEGVGFRAFDTESSATVPVHRFFNMETGGHFFTASEFEKEAVLEIASFRYEGEAFFAFLDSF